MREIIRNLIKPQMGKRLFMVIFGQVIMGCGVAVMRLAALGTDPFSAMMLGLTNHTPLSYGTFCALGNVAFFVIEFLLGKKYIGFGTLANWFLLGYFVELFEWIFRLVGITAPVGIPVRGVVLLLGIVLVALSLLSLKDDKCRRALAQLPELSGCQAHSTVMLSEVDRKVFKRLGVGLTCDPCKK